MCKECNDDCKKCCDTFFPETEDEDNPPWSNRRNRNEFCKATPGANAHFCLCGSADPFQSRGCGVDAPVMKDDESWVSPDEFDDFDAYRAAKRQRAARREAWSARARENGYW